jgi:hypothetical protein
MFLGINLNAQTKENKVFVGIIYGPSFPLGDFASTSNTNENAGFAKPDRFNYIFDFGYNFYKYFGVSASFYSYDFVMDLVSSNLSRSVGGIVAGPMVSIPLTKKFLFESKLNAGYVNSEIDDDNPKYEKYSGKGLGINLSASLRYNIIKHFCLITEAGYLYSNQKFDDGNRQKIQIFNVGMGLAFGF